VKAAHFPKGILDRHQPTMTPVSAVVVTRRDDEYDASPGSRRALPDFRKRARRERWGDALLHRVGEPPGQWAGKGAAILGLSGTVDAKIMDQLYMEHVGPSGELLARPRGKAKDDDQAEAAFRAAHPFASETEVSEAVVRVRASARVTVPYYDLTVSAARSISVLHASLKIAAQEQYYRGDLVAAGS
jgi:TrwC relaxase